MSTLTPTLKECSAGAAQRRSLRCGVLDGAAFSVMVGCGETYLPAFALAVGLGEVVAGLIATLPMLAGASLQLLSPRLIPRVGTHRRWVVLCALVQAVAFAPLVMAAAVGRVPALAVAAIATLYWAGGIAAGPAWNTWMARAVPVALRARYFATRSRVAQMCVLAGLVGGGFVLQYTASRAMVLGGFMLLFAVAGLARVASAGFLFRQGEPGSPIDVEQRVSLLAFLKRLPRRESRLLAYMLAVQVMTYLSAPYFTPYMLGELKFRYSTYMLLLATAFLAKAIMLPFAGRIAERFGAKPLLWIGGVGVVPLSALWFFSTSPAYLLLMQVIGGAAWGCYEFATFLLLFEAIRDDERTSMLTSFHFMNAGAQALGAALGGLLLRAGGVNFHAYMLLFVISSVGRLLTLPLLRTLAEIPIRRVRLTFRTLSVRPSAGSDDRPILATLPEPVEKTVMAPPAAPR
ncbi:MAG TPA: MFS transporter [Phycisphaerae bacterium]|nr:MFS transporter [Phycisphaerae bacterium]